MLDGMKAALPCLSGPQWSRKGVGHFCDTTCRVCSPSKNNDKLGLELCQAQVRLGVYVELKFKSSLDES